MLVSNRFRYHPLLLQKITLFVGSILITNIVSAHKCYVCGPNNNEQFFNISTIPSCNKFNPNDIKFTRQCAPDSKGCSIITNGTITTRTCEFFAFEDCKIANNVGYCYCKTELCNKYHPTHVDEEFDDDIEASGDKNIPINIDITTTTTTMAIDTTTSNEIKSNDINTKVTGSSNSFYKSSIYILLTVTIFYLFII